MDENRLSDNNSLFQGKKTGWIRRQSKEFLMAQTI
jgi:hypothetical protein